MKEARLNGPTDSSNQTTEYAYDGDNHVVMMTAVMPSGETSQITHYVYGVTTAQGSSVDDNDLLYEVQYPDPASGTNTSSGTYNQGEFYKYDGTGEQTGYTDRNGTVHAYSYDQLGRLTADQITTFGTGVDSTVARLGYAFNDAGLQSTATSYNASGGVLNQIADSYDGFGQLTNEYQEHDGSVDTDSSQAVSYSYDATNGDRPTSLTYPNGREVDYNYDSGLDSILGRVSSVSDSLETMQVYTYLGLDTPVTFTDGNGVELSYLGTATSTGTGAGDQYAGLDRFGRIVDQKWTNTSTSATVDEFQYTYDADGNVLTKNNMVLSGDDESFTYDGLNRLTAYTQGSNSEGWSLDALGNWNSQTINGTTTSRTTSAQNQVKTVGSATLGYDNNGNTLTDNTGQQYVYDGWNRLVTVKNSGGTTIASYTYDPEGRRITQTEAGTTTDLYYSDRWQVIEEHVADNTTVQFTWGVFYVNQLIASDAVITEIDDGHGEDFGGTRILVGGRNYAEQDADWDVTSMTDDGGSVLERYQYDPTGNVVVLNPTGTTLGAGMNSSTIGQVIGYQGGWTDSSTGLVTFQYRDLNTGLGRWIEQDPAGYVNGPNRYQLELINTIASVDPCGLDDDGFAVGLSQMLSDGWNKWFGTPDQPGPAAAVGQGVANAGNGGENFLSDFGNSFLAPFPPGFGDGNPVFDNPLNPNNPGTALANPDGPGPLPLPMLPRPDWSKDIFLPESDADHSNGVNIAEGGWALIFPGLVGKCFKGLFPPPTETTPAGGTTPLEPNSPSDIEDRLNRPGPPIDWAKQGKHIVGSPNYNPDLSKSILTSDPDSLSPYAGWGDPRNSLPPGSPGYKEVVDFGMEIGQFIQQLPDGSFSEPVPTTRGTIHYSNNGIHVVPAPPIAPGG